MPTNSLLTKRGIGIVIILSLFAIWGVVRSCSKQEIAQKQVYVIGRDSTWYPHNLMGKERNLEAFTNDLFAEISKEINLSFYWANSGPSSILEGLNAGNYDAIISSLRPDVVNKHTYLFSELFFQLGPVLVVRKGANISSLKELQGKTVGIPIKFYTTFNDLNEIGPSAYDIQLVTYDNRNQALDRLESGRFDGVIMDSIPAYTLTEKFYSNRLKVATAPFTDDGLRLVALKRGDTLDLMERFDTGLKKLKEDGIYKELHTKWNLVDPEVKFLNDENK